MHIRNIDDLGLPSILKKIAQEERGLVSSPATTGQRQEHDAGGG